MVGVLVVEMGRQHVVKNPQIRGFTGNAQELATSTSAERPTAFAAALGPDLSRPMGADGNPMPGALLQGAQIDGHPPWVAIEIVPLFGRTIVRRSVHREMHYLDETVGAQEFTKVIEGDGEASIQDLEGRCLSLLSWQDRMDPHPVKSASKSDGKTYPRDRFDSLVGNSAALKFREGLFVAHVRVPVCAGVLRLFLWRDIQILIRGLSGRSADEAEEYRRGHEPGDFEKGREFLPDREAAHLLNLARSVKCPNFLGTGPGAESGGAVRAAGNPGK